MQAEQIRQLLAKFTPTEKAYWYQLALQYERQRVWRPLSGPQAMAYHSKATIIGYGGAAGGGKTDLACGKALAQHRKVAIFRRIGTELTAVLDRLTELLGHRNGYNGKDLIWRLPGGATD